MCATLTIDRLVHHSSTKKAASLRKKRDSLSDVIRERAELQYLLNVAG